MKRIHLFLIAFVACFILFYVLTSGSGVPTAIPTQRIINDADEYDGTYIGTKLSERLIQAEYLDNGNVLLCKRNGSWIIANKNGEILSKDQPLFNVSYIENRHFSATETLDSHKYAVFNFNGERLTDYIYDDGVEYIDENVGIFYKNQHYGFINNRGEEPFNTLFTFYYYDPEAKKVITEDESYIFKVYDFDFNLLNTLDVDYIEDYTEGLVFALKDDHYGFYDTKGNLVISGEGKFDTTSGFVNGYALVFNYGNEDTEKEKYTIIDKKGNELCVLNDFIDLESLYSLNDASKNGIISFSAGDTYTLYDLKNNKAISEDEYCFIDAFDENGYAIAEDGEYAGLIDDRGNTIFNFVYDSIGKYQGKDGTAVYKDGLWYIVDEKEKPISKYSYEFDEMISPKDGLAIVSCNDYYGVISVDSGELLFGDISERSGLVYSIDNTLANNTILVKNSEFYYGVIDNEGNEVLPFEYDNIKVLSENLFLVDKDLETYLIDRSGKELAEFEDVYGAEIDPDGKHFTIDTEEGTGFVDEKGNIVIEPKYPYIGYFGDIIPVCESYDTEEVRLINSKGEYVNDTVYPFALDFCNGRIAVENTEGYYGYLDKDGNTAIDFKYVDAGNFTEKGVAWVVDEEYDNILIDLNGNIIAKVDADIVENTEEPDRFSITTNGLYGLIDDKGNVIAEPVYDYIDFSYFDRDIDETSLDYLIISKGGLEGVMDRNGNILVEPKFGNLSFFVNGIARAELDGKYGFIDTTGNFVIEPKYQIASYFMNGVAVAYDTYQDFNAKGSLINEKNEPIADISKYDLVYPFSYGTCKAESAEEIYLLNTKGEVIYPKAEDLVDLEDYEDVDDE